MDRTVTGFRRDDAGDWVAELACRHRQHVRHQPPFRLAPWVQDEGSRQERIGSAMDCPLCDRCELPEDLHVVRTTADWDAAGTPAGLLRSHRVAAGVWGRIHVEAGALRFVAATSPPIDVVLTAGHIHPIPPEVEHRVEPGPSVRFHLEFLGPSDPPAD